MSKGSGRPSAAGLADDLPAPIYRTFRDSPNGVFVDAFAAHIRETGKPETFDGLFRGKIDRNARFRIIRKFTIDRKKRPERDMAPCPRCGYDDKFLEGALAWFPDLQVCAAIGHCCGGHEVLAEAERDYKHRKLRDQRESFLLATLPLLGEKAEFLKILRAPATEALRIYRQFRRQGAPIYLHLRGIKENHGGQLRVTELLKGGEGETESDYFGPAGFHGRNGNEVVSRDHDLGQMTGFVALIKDYNPVKELDDVCRWLNSFDARPTEEEALNLIVNMSEPELRAAVEIVRGTDQRYEKFAKRIAEFWSFFAQPNIECINGYGTHPLSPVHFEAVRVVAKGRVAVTFRQRGLTSCLNFDDRMPDISVNWPIIPFGAAD